MGVATGVCAEFLYFVLRLKTLSAMRALAVLVFAVTPLIHGPKAFSSSCGWRMAGVGFIDWVR